MSFDLTQLPRPIIVLGTPRSGTSLTAGLFAKHGAWVGRCREGDSYNALGYFENLDLKQGLLELFGRLVNKGELAGRPPPGLWASHVRTALNAGEYPWDGTPWLAKHSAMYFPAWEIDFNPIYVCCFRDPVAIAASVRATGLLEKPEAIDAHRRVMEGLLDHGAHEVWPEAFIHHEWHQIIPAFTEAGLAFDHEIAEDFVDPNLWHDWSTAHAAPA